MSHATLINQAGRALENITALSAVEVAGDMQIMAAGLPGLTLATLPGLQVGTASIGTGGANVLTGGAKGDLLWGAAGDDTLSGGGGADVLAGGDGRDRLTGGTGADVFVFDQNPDRDEITDFVLGQDRVDLSRWGRLYDASSLTIEDRWNGADIFFGGYSVRVTSADQTRLTEELLGNDSFIF